MKIKVNHADKDLFCNDEEWDVVGMTADEKIIDVCKKDKGLICALTNEYFKEVFGEEALKEVKKWCKLSPLTIIGEKG